jgi:hypothetical protein
MEHLSAGADEAALTVAVMVRSIYKDYFELLMTNTTSTASVLSTYLHNGPSHEFRALLQDLRLTAYAQGTVMSRPLTAPLIYKLPGTEREL